MANAGVRSTRKQKIKSESTMEIQKYIDTFNKELEGAEETVIEITQPDEQADANEPGTYFVDEDGQFYFQPANTEFVDCESAVAEEPAFDDAPASPQEELSYVYIVQEDEQGEKEENDMTVYDFAEEDNDNADGAEAPVESEPENDKSQIVKPKGAKAAAGAKVFLCTFCNYSNSKRFLLTRHMKIHTAERPHKCSVCAKGFRSLAALNNHENTHSGLRPHHCSHCPAAFATTGELHRHVRYRHTRVRPHRCPDCDYAAVEYSKLRRHRRCHSGERPYQCPHCTYASPDTFKLKRHIRVHTGERPYTCELCTASFSQSNSLKAHRLTHYPDRKPTFQCELCPAKCGRKADLRGHIRKLHTATEPLECKRCGKRLPDRYSYKVHVRTHDGEKSFRCEVCPYASISALHLSSHMLIHTNEKPFTCNLCDQRFRQKQLLKRHQNLYHNPEYVPPKPRPKNHECEECGRKFIHQGNLIRHLAMHDPESNVHEENIALKIGRKQKVKHVDELDGTEIILEGEDGSDEDGQYVVFEMIQLEEDGRETVRIINTMEAVEDKKPVVKQPKEPVDTKLDMQNCFGFDEDEDDDNNLLIARHDEDYDDDDDDEEEYEKNASLAKTDPLVGNETALDEDN